MLRRERATRIAKRARNLGVTNTTAARLAIGPTLELIAYLTSGTRSWNGATDNAYDRTSDSTYTDGNRSPPRFAESITGRWVSKRSGGNRADIGRRTDNSANTDNIPTHSNTATVEEITIAKDLITEIIAEPRTGHDAGYTRIRNRIRSHGRCPLPPKACCPRLEPSGGKAVPAHDTQTLVARTSFVRGIRTCEAIPDTYYPFDRSTKDRSV